LELRHVYDRIDLDILWNTVRDRLRPAEVIGVVEDEQSTALRVEPALGGLHAADFHLFAGAAQKDLEKVISPFL
jgi:hypothetical protein